MKPLALLKATLALAFASVLAACSSSVSEDVSGTAAVGAPLANATVTLLCNNGGTPTTATTSSSGGYNMSLPGTCSAPYFLKVVGIDTTVTPNATTTLYAFADKSGNINITPLTDIAARFATGGNPDAEYEAVKGASKKAGDLWNSASAAEGKAKLLETLTALGLDSGGISDLLHGPFKAQKGDKTDDLLEALKAKRGSVSLADLAVRFGGVGGQVANKPWNFLFPAGKDEVSMELTGCSLGSSYGYIDSSAGQVKFKRVGDTMSVSVSLAASPTLSLVPLVIGGTATNFGVGINGGTGTYVELYGQVQSTDQRNGGSFETNPPNAEAAAVPNSMYREYYFSFSGPTAGPGGEGGGGAMSCKSMVKPMALASYPALTVGARMASFASISPSLTVTSAFADGSDDSGFCRGDRDDVLRVDLVLPTPAMTYSFALSKLGEISFDGVVLKDPFSTVDSPYARYYENTYFDDSSSRVFGYVSYLRNSRANIGFSMNRDKNNDVYCGGEQ